MSDEVEFGTEEELRARHPKDKPRWFSSHKSEPTEGQGLFGDAVEVPEHGWCISYFVGCGTSFLVTKDGRFIGEDRLGEEYARVKNGAWISEHLYAKSEKDHVD